MKRTRERDEISEGPNPDKHRSLDDQIANTLDLTMKGDINAQLNTVTMAIYSMCKDHFRVKQPQRAAE